MYIAAFNAMFVRACLFRVRVHALGVTASSCRFANKSCISSSSVACSFQSRVMQSCLSTRSGLAPASSSSSSSPSYMHLPQYLRKRERCAYPAVVVNPFKTIIVRVTNSRSHQITTKSSSSLTSAASSSTASFTGRQGGRTSRQKSDNEDVPYRRRRRKKDDWNDNSYPGRNTFNNTNSYNDSSRDRNRSRFTRDTVQGERGRYAAGHNGDGGNARTDKNSYDRGQRGESQPRAVYYSDKSRGRIGGDGYDFTSKKVNGYDYLHDSIQSSSRRTRETDIIPKRREWKEVLYRSNEVVSKGKHLMLRERGGIDNMNEFDMQRSDSSEEKTKGKEEWYDKVFFSKMRAGASSLSSSENENRDNCIRGPLGQGLSACGFDRLAHIQANTLRALKRIEKLHRPGHSRGRQAMKPAILVADQAGSGKTLAYLIPSFMQMMRGEEDENLNYGHNLPHSDINARENDTQTDSASNAVTSSIQRSRPKCPSVIILVPTAELANQTLKVVRQLSHSHPSLSVRSLVMTGGDKPGRTRTQRVALQESVDIVIGTPSRVASHIKMGNMSLDGLKSFVIDEVDVLLDEYGDFGKDTDFVLSLAKPMSCLSMIVSATISKKNMRTITSRFLNGVEVVTGPNVHRVAPGMAERLIDCGKPDTQSPSEEPSHRSRSKGMNHYHDHEEDDDEDDAEDAHRRHGGHEGEDSVAAFEKKMFTLKADALPDVLGIPRNESTTQVRDDVFDQTTDFNNQDGPSLSFVNELFPRNIIFCNTIDSCRKVESFLKRRDRKEKNYRVLAYHSAIDNEIRENNLKEFMRDPASVLSQSSGGSCSDDKKERKNNRRVGRESSSPSFAAPRSAVVSVLEQSALYRRAEEEEEGAHYHMYDNDRHSPRSHRSMAQYRALPIIFVCTDRLSRGLDLVTANHAILFDFPRDPHEYVRRVGRVCRGPLRHTTATRDNINDSIKTRESDNAFGEQKSKGNDGWQGLVTILAVGRQVALAKEIMNRNESRELLHPLPRAQKQ